MKIKANELNTKLKPLNNCVLCWRSCIEFRFQTRWNYQFPQEVCCFLLWESQTFYILMATPNKTAAKATLKEETTVESLREWQKHFKTAQRGWGKFSENWFHSILYLKYKELNKSHTNQTNLACFVVKTRKPWTLLFLNNRIRLSSSVLSINRFLLDFRSLL